MRRSPGWAAGLGRLLKGVSEPLKWWLAAVAVDEDGRRQIFRRVPVIRGSLPEPRRREMIPSERRFFTRLARPRGFHLTLWSRKADSNRRCLSVNELVSQARMRMRARRQGWVSNASVM